MIQQANVRTRREPATTGSYLVRFLVRNNRRVVALRADQVDWLAAAGNSVFLHHGADTHLLRKNLAGLEARLDPARFVRINRAALVNIDRIKEIAAADASGVPTVVLHDGTRLPLTRRVRELYARLEYG